MSAARVGAPRRLGRVKTVVVTLLVGAILTIPAFVPRSGPSKKAVTHDSHLVGMAADEYLARKAEMDPAFARFLQTSEADLAAKGWTKPAGGSLALIRTSDVPRASAFSRLVQRVLGGRVAAQELDAGTGSGEIVFSSWDDGDNNTWEGTIWIQDYTSGDTFYFETQFDYGASVDGVTLPNINWIGNANWRDRDGHTREASLTPEPGGVLAGIGDAICPTLTAQATAGLSCRASPSMVIKACMKQGFSRVGENAFWLLSGAAAAGLAATPGVVTAPVAFLGTLGVTGAGVLLDGYVGELNSYLTRCSR